MNKNVLYDTYIGGSLACCEICIVHMLLVCVCVCVCADVSVCVEGRCSGETYLISHEGSSTRDSQVISSIEI